MKVNKQKLDQQFKNSFKPKSLFKGGNNSLVLDNSELKIMGKCNCQKAILIIMAFLKQYNIGTTIISLYKIWKIMKKVYTVPTPREQKLKGQQKSQNEVINQTQFAYIPDQATQKEQSSKMARPYLMFKPKLVEEIDENNMKKMKLSFHNSITDLQTFEELAKESQQRESTPNLNITPQEKTKTFVRKSMRHLTQL